MTVPDVPFEFEKVNTAFLCCPMRRTPLGPLGPLGNTGRGRVEEGRGYALALSGIWLLAQRPLKRHVWHGNVGEGVGEGDLAYVGHVWEGRVGTSVCGRLVGDDYT